LTVARQKRPQACFPHLDVPSVVAALAVAYRSDDALRIPPTDASYWRAIVEHLRCLPGARRYDAHPSDFDPEF
jgi:hypothetical protein